MDNFIFFVMLNHPSSRPVPLEDAKGVAWFNSAHEAIRSAENSSLGHEFGYEVFERGEGTITV